MRSKGQLEWTEVFTLICVAAAILLIVLMFPEMLTNMASLFAMGSAEAVSRDVAGLVTISGAAFDDASITYTGAVETVVYDVLIKDKLVSVESILLSSGGVVPPHPSAAGVANLPAFKQGVSRIPFDVSADISSKNTFDITKSVFPDGSNYDIQVK